MIQQYPLQPSRCTGCPSQGEACPEVNGCHPGLTAAKLQLSLVDLGFHLRPFQTCTVRFLVSKEHCTGKLLCLQKPWDFRGACSVAETSTGNWPFSLREGAVVIELALYTILYFLNGFQMSLPTSIIPDQLACCSALRRPREAQISLLSFSVASHPRGPHPFQEEFFKKKKQLFYFLSNAGEHKCPLLHWFKTSVVNSSKCFAPENHSK